jgi:DHA2 family multidrug resistance protein
MPELIGRMALWSLLLGTTLQALDLTIATIALPAIERDLGLDFEDGTWILTSYIVATALMTPVAGALSAAVGRRATLLLAIGGLTLASLGCGSAASFSTLLAFRLVQGAAAGIIMPLVQATLLDMTPKAEHGRAMSLFGAAIMVGPVLGPTLGGVLVDSFGWRSIFFINLPIGLLAFAGTALGLAELPKSGPARLDIVGLGLFGSGVVALQLLLDRGPRHGWLAAREITVYSGIALVALVVAVARSVQRRAAFPALAPFRDRNFAATTVCSFLAGFAVIGSVFLVPSLLQNLLGYGATASGFAMAPRGVGTMAMMLAMSRTVGRIDHRTLLLTGVVLIEVAFLGFSMLKSEWGIGAVASLSLLQGLGVGLIFTPLSTAAFSSLAAELRPDATGVYSLLRNIGGSAGVAILSALLLRQGSVETQHIAGYHADFLILLGVIGVMGITAMFIRTELSVGANGASGDEL